MCWKSYIELKICYWMNVWMFERCTGVLARSLLPRCVHAHTHTHTHIPKEFTYACLNILKRKLTVTHSYSQVCILPKASIKLISVSSFIILFLFSSFAHPFRWMHLHRSFTVIRQVATYSGLVVSFSLFFFFLFVVIWWTAWCPWWTVTSVVQLTWWV